MISVEIADESMRELEALRRRHAAATRALAVSGNTPVTRMLATIVADLGEAWEAGAPRLTGTLASATRTTVFEDVGRVFIDPSIENPVFGGRPVIYGPVVHTRKPWVDQVMKNDAPRSISENVASFYAELDQIYRV